MRDAGDVEAASGHVGGDEDFEMMLALKSSSAFWRWGWLLLPWMDSDLKPRGDEVRSQSLDAVLGPAEDEHFVEIRADVRRSCK